MCLTYLIDNDLKIYILQLAASILQLQMCNKMVFLFNNNNNNKMFSYLLTGIRFVGSSGLVLAASFEELFLGK